VLHRNPMLVAAADEGFLESTHAGLKHCQFRKVSAATDVRKVVLAFEQVWFPWNAIFIASYETSKQRAAQMLDADPLPAAALAACSAGSASIAVIVTHPVDVVKTQLQVGRCKPWQAIRTILLEVLSQDCCDVHSSGQLASCQAARPG